jgi:hypothetical protein
MHPQTEDVNRIEEVFTSLDSVQIDHSDLSASFKTIQRHYFKIFQDLLLEFKQFHLKKDTQLFRVRKNLGDLPFMYPDELSHPPAHLTNFGRVNLKNRPVFYCSDNLSTAILELKPEVNDYLTLAESKLSEDLLIAVIGDVKRYKTEGIQSSDLKTFYERITPIITRPIKSDVEYLFTATLADVIFSDEKFKGIMYPSYYSKTKADNFALRVDGLDQKLMLTKMTLLKITEKTSENKLIIKCISNSNSIDIKGQFIWKNVSSCDTHLIHFDDDLNLE